MRKNFPLRNLIACIADIDAVFERGPVPSLDQACEIIDWGRHDTNPEAWRDAIHLRILKALNVSRWREIARRDPQEAAKACLSLQEDMPKEPVSHRETQDSINFILSSDVFAYLNKAHHRYTGWAFTEPGSEKNGANVIVRGEQIHQTLIHETRHQRDSWLMQEELDPQIRVFKEEALAFLAEGMPVFEILGHLFYRQSPYKINPQQKGALWHKYCQVAARAICSAWHRHHAKGVPLDILSTKPFDSWPLPTQDHIFRVHRSHLSGLAAGHNGVSQELASGGYLPHADLKRILRADLGLETHAPIEHACGIWIGFVRSLRGNQGYYPMIVLPR